MITGKKLISAVRFVENNIDSEGSVHAYESPEICRLCAFYVIL